MTLLVDDQLYVIIVHFLYDFGLAISLTSIGNKYLGMPNSIIL